MITFYIWLIILLYVGSSVARFIFFIKGERVRIIELIESLGGVISCVGLYGYLSKTYYLNPTFWYAVILVALCFGVYSNIFSKKTKDVVKKIGFKRAVAIYGTVSIVTLPHLYILFLYASSSNF